MWLQEIDRAFTDLRFVWPAVGASVAAALCLGLATTVWRAASTDEPTWLPPALIESLSDPGSDRNPLRLDGAISVPRALSTEGQVVHAVLDGHDSDEEVLAVAAVVKRDGKIGTYELLGAGQSMPRRNAHQHEHGEEGVADLLAAVREARFAPAQAPGGRTVAVNMVWLFAKTTVRASSMPVDLGVRLSRPLSVTPARRSARPRWTCRAAGRAGTRRTPLRRRDSLSDGLRPLPPARLRARWPRCSARPRRAGRSHGRSPR